MFELYVAPLPGVPSASPYPLLCWTAQLPPLPLEQHWAVEHAAQAAPPWPHDEPVIELDPSQVPVMPPLQQPVGHVLESHEQVPLVLSHRLFEHVPHELPPVPHCEGDCDAYATHVVPLQQPPEHEVASQTHWPVVLLHSWPVPQPAHAAPPVPHCELVSEPYGMHVLPLQHPLGQEVLSQTHCPVVVLHSWPPLHFTHAPPPAPHALLFSLASGSQVVPLQQPLHIDPPQLHTPFEHVWPCPHGPHTPPAVPHKASFCDP